MGIREVLEEEGEFAAARLNPGPPLAWEGNDGRTSCLDNGPCGLRMRGRSVLIGVRSAPVSIGEVPPWEPSDRSRCRVHAPASEDPGPPQLRYYRIFPARTMGDPSTEISEPARVNHVKKFDPFEPPRP